MRLVIITGMPGAGKSEVAQVLREAGFPVISMGDVVRDELRKRGLEPNPVNTGTVMLDLREREGPAAVARRCLDELKSMASETVVIEGCRSIAELEVFEQYAEPVTVLCIHSSPSTRFARLRQRARNDAPPEWSAFRERDSREISVGLGGIIALSDIMLINEGSIDDLRQAARKICARFQRDARGRKGQSLSDRGSRKG
jgi:dephospho-CoA kinase